MAKTAAHAGQNPQLHRCQAGSGGQQAVAPVKILSGETVIIIGSQFPVNGRRFLPIVGILLADHTVRPLRNGRAGHNTGCLASLHCLFRVFPGQKLLGNRKPHRMLPAGSRGIR